MTLKEIKQLNYSEMTLVELEKTYDELIAIFQKETDRFNTKGIKVALKNARSATNEMGKLGKYYRKASIEATK